MTYMVSVDVSLQSATNSSIFIVQYLIKILDPI